MHLDSALCFKASARVICTEEYKLSSSTCLSTQKSQLPGIWPDVGLLVLWEVEFGDSPAHWGVGSLFPLAYFQETEEGPQSHALHILCVLVTFTSVRVACPCGRRNISCETRCI